MKTKRIEANKLTTDHRIYSIPHHRHGTKVVRVDKLDDGRIRALYGGAYGRFESDDTVTVVHPDEIERERVAMREALEGLQ